MKNNSTLLSESFAKRSVLQIIITILIFLNVSASSVPAVAQTLESHATLSGWEQRIRNFIFDRSHNYGGTNYNRGLFRENIEDMSPEHEMDLLTYRFSLTDDYEWMVSDNIYRSNFGSLNATRFAVENRLKTKASLNKNNDFYLNSAHEENLRANRFLFVLGFEHHFGKDHHLGGRHTLSNEKSDLDLTVYYRYGNNNNGMAEAAVTFLDWAGNMVQGLAKESSNEYNRLYPETHRYHVQPRLLSLKLFSPHFSNYRAEFMAGVQTFSEKGVNPAGDTLNYVDEEWAHYIGGMIEYYNQILTTGLTWQRTFSKLKRAPAADSRYELDFGNWQFSNRLGFYVITRLGYFKVEQWIWYERNVDRLQGEKVPGDLTPLDLNDKHVPFNFIEKRIKMKGGVSKDPPERGLKTGLIFHADYRYPQGKKDIDTGVKNQQFRRVYPIVRNRNDRITFTLGYRVNQVFYFVGGISYDLDRDSQSGMGLPRITGTPTWFDGGFGRLSVQW